MNYEIVEAVQIDINGNVLGLDRIFLSHIYYGIVPTLRYSQIYRIGGQVFIGGQ